MKTPQQILIIALLLTPLSVFSDTLKEKQETGTIKLGTWSAAPLTIPDGRGLFDQMMKEAFDRCCNLSSKVIALPPERSLKLANSGVMDGELPRIANISGPNSNYPNLVQVDVPVIPISHIAFSTNPDIQIKQWDEFKSYNVGIVTGWKILERNIKNYRSLTKFDSEASLFNALKKGRIDVAVYSRLSGLMEIKKLDISGIYGSNAPKLQTGKYTLYLYMHKKHKSLIPKLEKALASMKTDGTYARIFCDTLKDSLPKEEANKVISNLLDSLNAKGSCS